MGLLTALDFHQKLQLDNNKKSAEIEYQLYSWGEICKPFLGNPEHSLGARHILNDFPFKLFSSSTPTGPLPQKLCLIFRPPEETRIKGQSTIQGIFPNEIVKEFVAFLSLVTRRRVFVNKQTRYNGLPIEKKAEIYQRSHFQEAQKSKEIDPKKIYQLLENIRLLDRPVANSFILAMRLYHTAVEMMYTEPEFSYLLLVTCLEAISSLVNTNYSLDNKDSFLDSKFPGWKDIDKHLKEEKDKDKLKDVLLKNEHCIFRKLCKFVLDNVPDNFYNEDKDDTKPDYYTNSPLQEYEKIKKEDLSKALHNIYDARSALVHKGVRLPQSIVLGHFGMLTTEVVAEMIDPGWKPEIPSLLTFERLVSYTMTEFLNKQNPDNAIHSPKQK